MSREGEVASAGVMNRQLRAVMDGGTLAPLYFDDFVFCRAIEKYVIEFQKWALPLSFPVWFDTIVS